MNEHLNKISDILSFDDKDENEKIQQVQQYIADVTRGKKKILGVINYMDSKIDIQTIKKVKDIRQYELIKRLGHDNFYYICCDENEIGIFYNEINIVQLIENLQADLEAGNFDLSINEVDEDYYNTLLVKMKKNES